MSRERMERMDQTGKIGKMKIAYDRPSTAGKLAKRLIIF